MEPGEWNKFGAPMFEPEVFRKQMYCFAKSAYDIVVTFWPPAVIRRPGNCVPLPSSLHFWCYAIKIGKITENKQIPNVMAFYSMNICNFRTQCHMDLAQIANKSYWRHFKFLRVVFVSLPILHHAFLWWGPVLVLLIIKLFRYSTSYFFKFR